MKDAQSNLYNWNQKFNWTKYNKSQTQEKVLFLELLKDLCDILPKKWKYECRRPIQLHQIIFSICVKSYCLKSGRRAVSELKLCEKLGYIKKICHFNTIFNYLKNPKITLVLQELIKLTSLPLRSVETKLCGDSTGISTSVLGDRWSVIRQNYSQHHKYMKIHASFGTLTNIITSCRITKANVHDSKMFSELVDESCENFNPKEYS